MPNPNKFSDKFPQYRDKGRLITHGSIDDLVARTEWRFYSFLQKIMGFAAFIGIVCHAKLVKIHDMFLSYTTKKSI